MTLRRSAVSAVLLTAVSLVACEDLSDPVREVPSILATGYSGPDVVAEYVGGRLRVDYTTYRNNCRAWAGDDVELDVRTHTVTIRAYDKPGDELCFPEFDEADEHRVSVMALASGIWNVRVVGVEWDESGPIDPYDPYRPVTLTVFARVP